MGIAYIQAREDAPDIRNEFIDVYRTVFAGAPYFESHSRSEVARTTWAPHLKRGVVVIARACDTVVGFGCAIPLRDPLVSSAHVFVRARGLPLDIARTWYMSELGVLAQYRGHGIGSALVRERLLVLSVRGSEHYVLRTASEGSHSESLYRKIGAIECGEDTETGQRYFYGSTSIALSKLQAAP